jgi:hypothetical protein
MIISKQLLLCYRPSMALKHGSTLMPRDHPHSEQLLVTAKSISLMVMQV